MRKLTIPVYLIITTGLLFSCVPARKFEEVKSKHEKCADENIGLRASKKELEESNTELTQANTQLEKTVMLLEKDTSLLGVSLRQKERQYDKINLLNEEIQKKLEQLKKGNEQEAARLSSQLLITQADLQRKEDALRTLERELELKKENLERLQAELKKREERVKELEAILAKKDSAVNAIRKKVQEALLGFEDEGLSIEQKNGKVYVSLEEQLLFASGSYTIEPKGVDILKKLAKVLEQNKDVNVMVEGHTDNVPYRGSGALKDNWDLSVKRATSVVKIITTNSSTDPKRLTAAGRGEYVPLDPANTADARRKNRRTEIILTPKLDELFKILETN